MFKILSSNKNYKMTVIYEKINNHSILKEKTLKTIYIKNGSLSVNIFFNKEKKIINYKHAWLEIYDKPVIYFPKFFHPDPTVKRQSGLLKPVLNNSNLLGNSIILPYFHVLSEDSDLTFSPTIFDGNIKMIQNEFRKVGKNFNLIANFGHTRNYKSSSLNKNQNTTILLNYKELSKNYSFLDNNILKEIKN